MRIFVAIDGYLYDHYPLFRHKMQSVVKESLGNQFLETMILELSNDGSRIGATLIAASNSRYSKKS